LAMRCLEIVKERKEKVVERYGEGS
jgi:hypothetical protein